MNKVDHYDWALPGDSGKFRCVPVHDLKIDHSYQRSPVGDGVILDIAREFAWSSFGVLIVMERSNGALYVVDGQQRLLACIRRGDIEAVPCYVFASEGRDHEARAFLGINTSRKTVRAIDKFHAADRAGFEPQRSISKWLAQQGLKIDADHGSDPDAIAWPKEIIETWKLDQEACKAAIAIQRKIVMGEPTFSKFHKGIWYLLTNGVDVGAEVDKIISLGGKTRIEHDIQNQQNSSGVRTYGQRTFALGILRTINYKRRNKIRLPGDGEDA